MKLNTVNRFISMTYCCNMSIIGVRNYFIVGRQLVDMIGMTHPYYRLFRNFSKEIRVVVNDKFRAAEFSSISFLYTSRYFVMSQNLETVTNPQNRNSPVKDSLI